MKKLYAFCLLFFPLFAWAQVDIPFDELKGRGKIEDGKRIGRWILYNSYGQAVCVGDYKEDKKHGEWIFYDEYGEMLGTGNYQNDIPVGEWKSYYPNGVTHSITHYNKQGLRDSTYLEYHYNGRKSV